MIDHEEKKASQILELVKQNNMLREHCLNYAKFKSKYIQGRHAISDEINQRPLNSDVRYGLKLALEILDQYLEPKDEENT